MRTSFAVLFAMALGGSSTASGQVVRVRTVESGSKPVAGALVSLRLESGKSVAQALTDEGGRAILRAPAPGNYRVRGDRIGYVGVNGSGIVLGAADTISITIEMPNERVMLPELTVTSSRGLVCELERESGTLMAAIWSEARKALAGTELTRTVRPPVMEVTTFERDFNLLGKVRSERSSTQRTQSSRPFTARDPAKLLRDGFVEERGGETWYYGPDANLLLSEEFLEVHCFRVVAGPKGSDSLVGLSFEPAKGRKVPEVRGTLWLDRRTNQLRFLEFGYTNLKGTQATGREGGRVDFERLPNGGWIVSEWTIRMPIVVRIQGRGLSDRDSVAGTRENGGRAEVVEGGSGAVKRNRAVLLGTVFDSLGRAPLDGVIVSIGGGGYVDTTDALGRYRIETPTEGSFVVNYDHPRFESLGLAPKVGSATLARGEAATVNAWVPGPAGLENACRDRSVDKDVFTHLAGMVRDSSGRPMASARVSFRWGGLPGRTATAFTNDRGHYTICGIPPNVPVLIRGEKPFVVSPHDLVLARDSVMVRDLTLTVPGRMLRRSAVEVTVTAGGTTAPKPVPDALVTLHPFPDSVRTDARGIARLEPVPAGRYLVEVKALGYQVGSREIQVKDRDTVAVAFPLETVVQTLATVEVDAAAPRVRGKLAGFEDRRRVGLGRFFTRDLLAEREHSQVSDVLRMSAGVLMVPLPDPCLGYLIATRRTTSVVRTTCGSKALPSTVCPLGVYVDGLPVWRPGQGDPFNIDQYSVRSLEAIEVYVGTVQRPVQYSGLGTECGVVVLWTRE